MLDFSHIGNQTQQTFTGVGGTDWQTWHKPRGATFVHFFMVGGAGGGGAGFTPGGEGASPGGGGGGSSGRCSQVFPAWAIPDVLYILIGVGGAGGVAASGSNGTNGYISIRPGVTGNLVLCQVSGGAGGGTPVNSTTGGSGGSAGTTTVIAGGALAGLSFPAWGNTTATSLAGQAGSAATAAGNGNDITLPVTGLLVTGGTAGGSIRNAPGASRLGGGFVVPAGGVFPPQQAGQNSASGSNGFQPIPKLQYYYGGTGGGSGATDGSTGPTGGNGGAGAYGCGGGGGGGSFTGGTRSVGGRGGDGLVVVTWW